MARTMQLDQALESIDAHGVFLCYDDRNGVELWTPATKVPITLRRAVVKYRSQLESMMQSGAAAVCPSRDAHRQYWRYDRREQQYYCEMCKQLEPYISMSREQQKRMAC